MCGISGGVSKQDVVRDILTALSKQEYRGYDSAGVASVSEEGKMSIRRTVGKVCELEKCLDQKPIRGNVGIAHTRWATHGGVVQVNTHPHISGHIAVVHNGIIENHEELRKKLSEAGYLFVSQTDTEVIPHLIRFYLERQYPDNNLLRAVASAIKELRGAYAIVVMSAHAPDSLIVARSGSPLCIGLGGDKGNFVASDNSALLHITNRFVFLEEGDIAQIFANDGVIYDKNGNVVVRKEVISTLSSEDVGKGGYLHFMQKEIFEQPRAVEQTISSAMRNGEIFAKSFGKNALSIFRKVKAVQIVACGTSYYAGLTTRYWIESLTRMACSVDVASEWRYRESPVHKDTLYIFISQSGETADTLACLRLVKEKVPKAQTLAICNSPESSLTREADLVFLTKAGSEIGVASTKAFTTQLSALMMLTLLLGKTRGLEAEKIRYITAGLCELPLKISEALALDNSMRRLSVHFFSKEHALFLGRGLQYPVALEGALKLKEISYIHAEGYQAGELKHGPLALVDENMPVIAVAPNDKLAEKLQSNVREVQARKGRLYIFAPKEMNIKDDVRTDIITVPGVDELLAPIVYVVPLQLLAYHVAVARGNDVDQPRNLAKSVTVE